MPSVLANIMERHLPELIDGCRSTGRRLILTTDHGLSHTKHGLQHGFGLQQGLGQHLGLQHGLGQHLVLQQGFGQHLGLQQGLGQHFGLQQGLQQDCGAQHVSQHGGLRCEIFLWYVWTVGQHGRLMVGLQHCG